MWTAFKSARTSRIWPIVYWLPTGIVAASHWSEIKTITGRSMQPALNPNSSLWRDIALFRRDVDADAVYNREDVVTLRSPEDPKRLLIKRILAKEGDTVKTLPPYPDAEVTIPKGHVWVEGDEHFWSDDSNRFGPVSECLVESKLVMILWPLNRFGRLQPDKKSVQERSKRVFHEEDRGNIKTQIFDPSPQPAEVVHQKAT